jgi:hypothetical protein
LPARAPWHAPLLHAARVSTGCTSLRKFGTADDFTPVTRTFTVADLPACVTVTTASPSPAARTAPPSTTATAGFDVANPAASVTSAVARPASAVTARSCWRAFGPASATSAG